MAKELFRKRVRDIVNELKIPLIDERIYSGVKLEESKYGMHIEFLFDEDESVIRGFCSLVEYFHTVMIS